MGIANIGVPGLVLILVLALIIFGPSKLPEIGRAAGTTIKEFKDATTGMLKDDEEETGEKEKEEKTE